MLLRFLSLALLIVVIPGCQRKCDENYPRVTDEEHSYVVGWIHTNGERWPFRNQAGLTDTVAILRDYMASHPPVINSSTGCVVEGSLHFDVQLDGSQLGFEVHVDQGQPAKIFCGKWFPIVGTTQTMQIGTATYNDVYTLSVDSSQVTTGPWRIYFCKSAGVVRFDFRQGVHWERI